MDMEWRLPEDWEQMTQTEHVEWHIRRVEVEEPAYDYLEEHGIWQCFQTGEAQTKLGALRQKRQYLEAVIALQDSEEFQGLKIALENTMTEARKALRRRVQIMAQQFKRSGFRDRGDEKRELVCLKERTNSMIGQAEEIEADIVCTCRKRGVAWEPFMQSHLLRSS